MLRKIIKAVLILLALFLVFIAVQLVRHWDTVQRVFLGGVKVYETVPPPVPANLPRPAILVFSKTNAFRHVEAIPAGNALFAGIAQKNGWGYFQTENGATFTPDILSRFDAVVFNNVSGDVFTLARRAFEAFINNGGGYVGIHAAGDNSHEAWGWYANQLIGARFTMHTMQPQFQEAKVQLEDLSHPVLAGLPSPGWKRTEEWYSFASSPRTKGYGVLMTVDERSYNPVGLFGKDLRMGSDHPVIWWHCMGRGRVLYSALGHRAEAFAEPEHSQILANAVGWAARRSGSQCDGAEPTKQAK